MIRRHIVSRLIAAVSGAGTWSYASATLVEYELSGFMAAQNAAAITLHSQATMLGSVGSVPFTVRFALETDSAPITVTDTQTFQRALYTGAVRSIVAAIGGYSFESNRPLFDDPDQALTSPWDEQLTDVSNSRTAGGSDQFIIETTDKSQVLNSPGPKNSIFNAFTRNIDLTVGSNTFTALDFRLTDTRLALGGQDIFGSSAVPTVLNLSGLNPFLTVLRLDLSAIYTGPAATTTTSKAIFSAQSFSFAVSPVPEFGGMYMLLLGLAAVAVRVRMAS